MSNISVFSVVLCVMSVCIDDCLQLCEGVVGVIMCMVLAHAHYACVCLCDVCVE